MDDQFVAAVDDSYLLLAFLTRRSLTMDEWAQKAFRRYAEVLVRIQALVAAGRVVSEIDRAAFKESFALLSDLARPVTIGTIRSYLNAHYRSRGNDGPASNRGSQPEQNQSKIAPFGPRA